MLDHNERLVVVSDRLVILLCHVLRDRDLLTVVLELLLHRVRLKVHAVDDVSALVTPVGDDRGANDLVLHKRSEMAIILGGAAQVTNLVKASDR